MITLLIQFGCVSKPNIPHSDKNVIPSSWLTKKSSIDDIHEANNNICLLKEGLAREMEKEQGIELKKEDQLSECIKETSNPFKHNLTDEYQVYEYYGREGRRLETGYALVVNSVIVDVIATLIAE